MSYSKEEILEAIRRTAEENDHQPLGGDRFRKETGIKTYDWKKYWARFGDAQKEAGLTPNQLNSAYDDEFLLKKVICLVRKLGKFPVYSEIDIERQNDPDLPTSKAFSRLGTKQQLVARVVTYCKMSADYNDVVELCEPILEKPDQEEKYSKDPDTEIGEVYLFKSGRYYKIGKTSDTVRRGKELRIQLPEKMTLIHSIKTDDPSGVEAYWHRRFASKRMQGEWFELIASDVKAFKRWQRIA